MKKFCLVLACLMAGGWVRGADSDKKERTLTIQGQGKSSAAPDVAVLSVEVSHEGLELDPLLARVRKDMEKALDGIKSHAIPEKDIQTEVFLVQPKYENDKRGNARRAGFMVTNRVSVKVRDIKKTGKILSTVVSAGGTTVSGPNFELDNPQNAEREALAAATRDARLKAETVAQAAGVQLGEIQSLNPQTVNWPQPRYHARMMMAPMSEAADMKEPIQAGEQTLTAYVSVTFTIK